MSAIKDIAQELWYRTPGKDRRRSRKISAELFRYEQIEKAAQEYLKKPDDPEKRKALLKALRPLDEADL